MTNIRKIEMTVQQIELIRNALGAVTPKALKAAGLGADDLDELDLLDGMLCAAVDGDPEETYAFWA